MCQIGRKDTFQRIMSVSEHFNHEAFDFIPRSFVLPYDKLKFQNYSQIAGKNAIYIAKPTRGAQGDDIILFRDLRDLTTKRYSEMVI